MSSEASAARKQPMATTLSADRDPFASGATPFADVGESRSWHVSSRARWRRWLVLLALIATLGYGGWSVVREIQRVQVEPAEHSPEVLADLDPLATIGTGLCRGDGLRRGARRCPAAPLSPAGA